MAEFLVDDVNGVQVINETDVDSALVFRALQEQAPEAAALVRWSNDTKLPQSRRGGLFERDRYVTPERTWEQMRVAYHAAETDDVVSGVLESTEALAFNRISVDADDPDETDVWNQIAEELDLDRRLREMWREDFVVSQFYCLPGSALVYTVDGPVPMADVQPGVDVWAVKDERLVARPVVAKVNSGVKPTWEIRTRNQTLRSTADHRILVFSSEGTVESRRWVELVWKEASEVVPGDVIVTMAKAPELSSGLAPTPDVARIVGLLVGDGTRNPKYSPTGTAKFELSVPEGAQRATWIQWIEDALGVEARSRPGSVSVRFNAPELRQWAWEVMREKSKDRFVPSWVWTAPRKVQEAFLEGYLAADGALDLRKTLAWNVCSVGERLVRELRVLADWVGYGATNVQVSRAHGFGREVDVFRFTLYPESKRAQIPSSYARRHLDMDLDEHLAGRTVVSSASTGVDELVYDIEVEDAHNFVADGVVVHNCAVWWGYRDFKVRGRTDSGTRRKKRFQGLHVPVGLTILDPLKVVPVGNLLFNREQLAYCADNVHEYDVIKAVIDGVRDPDPVISQLMVAPYTPDEVESRMLADDGINPARLFLLNRNNVWRHTDTRSQYQRFATVRLKSCFELLDLKQQLRAMDRAHLLGGTNFIVLVKKGDKDRPAKKSEIQGLQANVRNLARVPVIVGDDRLSIEIITPKTDTTLMPERYNGLDARLTARLYQMFMTGNFAAGAKGDDSIKLAKMVARGLESRRHLLKQSIQRHVLMPAYERNDVFTQPPELRFHPKRIALDFDPTYANFLLDLYDRGPLATESILEEIDYDVLVELRRRRSEKKFDKELAPRAAPGASNLGAPSTDPKGAGRTAGRRLGGIKGGGGAAPGSGQGQAPRDPTRLSDDK